MDLEGHHSQDQDFFVTVRWVYAATVLDVEGDSNKSLLDSEPILYMILVTTTHCLHPSPSMKFAMNILCCKCLQ
jgi:hypothetical protein